MSPFHLLSCLRNFFLFGLCFPLCLPAQSLVKGQILDDSTRKPVAYARVMIYGSDVGTLSNGEGQFLLKIPTELSNAAYLEIFCLGYEDKRIPLPEQGEQITTLLKVAPLDMAVVTIYSETAEGLLEKAIERIPDNFSNSPQRWEAFYRESQEWKLRELTTPEDTLRKQREVSIGEALVEAYLPSYEKGKDAQVKLLKGRLIRGENSPMDSINQGFAGVIESFEPKGGAPGQINFDIARHPRDFDFLDKKASKRYEFKLRGLIRQGSQALYLIDFLQRTEVEERNSMLDGKILLDSATLAFVSLEYGLSPEASGYTPRLGMMGMKMKGLDYRYRLDYQKLNGRWQLRYCQQYTSLYIGIPNGFMGQELTLDSRLNLRSELLFTQGLSVNAEPIPREERMLKKERFSEEASEYDPEFWGERQIMPLEENLAEQR